MFFFHFSACNCNAEGSNGITCDDNGACDCKDNFKNNQCDECNDGLVNFPTCYNTTSIVGKN